MYSELFTDFDAFAGSVRGGDWTMMLHNPARRSWEINVAHIAGIQVQVGRLGSGNIVEGQSTGDGTILYLKLSDACTYSASGRPIDPGSFMILEPGCQFCLSSNSVHDWCSILIPTVALERTRASGEPSSASEKTTCRVTRPIHRVANRFRRTVQEIMATAAKYPQLESSPAARVASAGLLTLGSSIVGQRHERESHKAGRPKVPRAEIIRRSLELLEACGTERVLVRDLAAGASMSERTIRTAFVEHYGVGPVRYLQLRNLHQVRRALRAADPEEVTVADVLLQHGEWEFGRFASRYKRLFGELPSETLRAHRPIVQVL